MPLAGSKESILGIADQSALAEALNRLWEQYRSQIEERITILESAAVAFDHGALSADQCAEACTAAHNLAGVLGTFGLEEGTAYAREAEGFYANGHALDAPRTGQPAAIALQLRAMLARRKSVSDR
jgi:HPt (histidine-containing phosphotransfer) domain-containing protein